MMVQVSIGWVGRPAQPTLNLTYRLWGGRWTIWILGPARWFRREHGTLQPEDWGMRYDCWLVDDLAIARLRYPGHRYDS